jgi:hypothetical protein
MAGFEVDYYTDYRPTEGEVKNKGQIKVHYSNNIKKDNYIILGTISGENHYGAPYYDKVFSERLYDVCNWMGGDALLYKPKLSNPNENFHVFEILKRK